MEPNKVPANLKIVSDSLVEAATYERLALIRRKGIMGLVSASFIAALLVFRALADEVTFAGPIGLGFIVVLFGFSYGFRRLLRQRPGWAPLFEHPKGRKFWTRYTFGGAAIIALMTLAMILGLESASPAVWSAFMAAVLGTMGALVLWTMPRSSPLGYSLLSPYMAALLLGLGVVPATDLVTTVGACLLVGILLESGCRLLAPRRWLVR